MTTETIAFWELAIDAVGLILCLMAVAHVVRQRLAQRPARRQRSDGEAGAFSAEIRLQQVQQKAEAALAALNAAVAVAAAPERTEEPPPPPARQPSAGLKTKKAPVEPAQSPYAAIGALADQGLDVDDIYRRLRIPKSEIRLALDLRHAGQGRLRATA